jgi:hypothetical protein
MRHLSTDELIDQLSMSPAGRAAEHLAVCGDCRRIADNLRTALELAHAAEVPEPSPLVWDHLPARIAEAVRSTPTLASSPWRLLLRRRWGWIATAAVLALAVSGLLFRPAGGGKVAGLAEIPQRPAPLVAGAIADAIGEDGSWALVAELSAAMDWDEARADGFGPQAGTADVIALQLPETERHELAMLLKQEMGIPPR